MQSLRLACHERIVDACSRQGARGRATRYDVATAEGIDALTLSVTRWGSLHH